MANIQITEENFLKAHKEGCSDVKKVLENLAPELFETKYPCLKKYKYSKLIVLFTSNRTGIVVESDDRDRLGVENIQWNEDVFIPIKGIQAIE